MSGGIVQLVATGAQDEWISGKPEVSFFRSNYRRYTHYANTVERQIIQGNPVAGGISTIRIEKKGDLLSYMYLSARDANSAACTVVDWSKVIDKIELMIGGQVVDTHDVTYSTAIEPVTGAQTFSHRHIQGAAAPVLTSGVNSFYPLKFFFCKDWSASLPLVALQFHDVELRITWSASLASATTMASSEGDFYNKLQYICWTNFVYLDQGERDFFAKNKHDMLITQVQRAIVSKTSSTQELAFAQPVKFIAFVSNNYSLAYGTSGQNSAIVKDMMLKTQVNGVDVGEFRHLTSLVDVQQYYHTPFGYQPTVTGASTSVSNVGMFNYCLDTSKLQPTGTLNFSRLDTYRVLTPSTVNLGFPITGSYFYAVNYNILRIQNGLGSILYAN